MVKKRARAFEALSTALRWRNQRFILTDEFKAVLRLFQFPRSSIHGERQICGKRLYLHSSIDHSSLFDLLQSAAGEVMLTYDDAKEVRDLATAHGFFIKSIPMKTTHHTRTYELAITNRPFATPNVSESLRLLEQPPRYRVRRSRARVRNGKT